MNMEYLKSSLFYCLKHAVHSFLEILFCCHSIIVYHFNFQLNSKHYYYCTALTCLNTHAAAMTELRIYDRRLFCVKSEYCPAYTCLCSEAVSAENTFFSTDERFCHTKRFLTS